MQNKLATTLLTHFRLGMHASHKGKFPNQRHGDYRNLISRHMCLQHTLISWQDTPLEPNRNKSTHGWISSCEIQNVSI